MDKTPHDTIVTLLGSILGNQAAILAGQTVILSRLDQFATVLKNAEEARAEWDRTQTAIAKSLMPDLSMNPEPVSDAESSTMPSPDTNPTTQEGAENRVPGASMPHAPQPQNATPAAIDPDELDWFVGADGKYFVHGKDGAPDRRATPREVAAIDGQVGSSRVRRQRVRR